MRPDKKRFFARSREKELKVREELGSNERGDIIAMILSAFLVIFPICVGLILLISLFVLLFFGAL